MKNILLDTTGYVAFKEGHPEALAVLQHTPKIGLSSIVLGELLSGFRASRYQAKHQQELNRFLESSRVTILPVTGRTANYYVNIYHVLLQRRQLIPTNDIWIAASALQHDLAVFTYDDHFRYIDDLVVGSTLADFR